MDTRALFVANLARWMRAEPDVNDVEWMRVIMARYGAIGDEALGILQDALLHSVSDGSAGASGPGTFNKEVLSEGKIRPPARHTSVRMRG